MRAPVPSEPPAAPADTALRVVLVEDHPGFREQLQHLLEGLGQVRIVHTADTDEAALAWLTREPQGWDLLVLDIFLAEGHGFRVLRACAARQPTQHAVFLTSYTRDPARQQAMALGANAVFDKAHGLPDFLAYAKQRRDAHVGG